MMRPWRSAGKFWHHEVTALSNTPSSRQLSKLKNQRPKGEGFQRENRRVPTLSFPLVSKAEIDIARDRRPCRHTDSSRIFLAPSMKIPPWTFVFVGGPIVSQVTLGSFSAPPVAGDLKNDLRVTWDTLGPPQRAKDPPGPESKRNPACSFCSKMHCRVRRPWRSAGQFWHHEVTAASYKPCASQPPALKAKEPKIA